MQTDLYDVENINKYFTQKELSTIKSILQKQGIYDKIEALKLDREKKSKKRNIFLLIVLLFEVVLVTMWGYNVALYSIIPIFLILMTCFGVNSSLSSEYKKEFLSKLLASLSSDIQYYTDNSPGIQLDGALVDKGFLNEYRKPPKTFYFLNKSSQKVPRYKKKIDYSISYKNDSVGYRIETETEVYRGGKTRFETTNDCYIYKIPYEGNIMQDIMIPSSELKKGNFSYPSLSDTIIKAMCELERKTENKYDFLFTEGYLYIKSSLTKTMFGEYQSQVIKDIETGPTLIPSLKEVLSYYHDTREVLRFIDAIEETQEAA